MNVKAVFTREFVLDVCTRFAGGETIASIALSSGNEPEEIEALLKAYQPEMEEAFRRAGEKHGSTSIFADSGKVDVLERIAAALERVKEILEHREREGV